MTRWQKMDERARHIVRGTQEPLSGWYADWPTAMETGACAKLPARGARKPNADEQAGDWGDVHYPRGEAE